VPDDQFRDQKRGVAYHEAGHAVVAAVLGLCVVKVVAGTEDDPSAGYTNVEPDTGLSLIDGLAICAPTAE
jgi:ATP-dependent Zn protease